MLKAKSFIAVDEIKSTLTHDSEVFRDQLNSGRSQLAESFAEIETTKYGILVVLDCGIENSSGPRP